jgi:Trk-type K+ transport system membrane component
MRKLLTERFLVELIASLFILLFLYTGLSKLKEPEEFQIVLSKSPLLATSAIALSWLLPIIEIVTSVLLFLPCTRKYGLAASMLLMTSFTIYISYMLLFTPSLPCSCGGVLKQLNWQQHLVFNIFFLFISTLALWLSNNNKLFIAINRNSRTPVKESRH